MRTYTPVPARPPATYSLPQDAIDLRRAQSVNSAFQPLADASAQSFDEIDDLIDDVAALPGVGAEYVYAVSVPCVCGVIDTTVANPAWSPNINGMRQAELASSSTIFVGLQCLPPVGRIVNYSLRLAGKSQVSGHSAMPEHPIASSLYRVTYNSYLLIASTAESGSQTYTGYDDMHMQTSGGFDHTIDYTDTPWGAHYQVVISGEYGTNSVAGAEVYTLTFGLRGLLYGA